MLIDVTITACLRPEVLRRTLRSFTRNALGEHDCRCIVNIDPVGWSKPEDVYDVCKEFFNEVKVREARSPSFGEAFKWTWEQVERDWTFHLEDDWELQVPTTVDDMRRILEKEDALALLRLPQFKCGESEMKNWNKFYPWNGLYYECPYDLRLGVGFCGHPSLIKSEFVKNCVQHLDGEKNPEKQFHAKSGPLMEEVMKWRYGVYGYPGHPNYIQDLGRRWMIEHGYQKRGSKAFFTEWEKTE